MLIYLAPAYGRISAITVNVGALILNVAACLNGGRAHKSFNSHEK